MYLIKDLSCVAIPLSISFIISLPCLPILNNRRHNNALTENLVQMVE